MVFGAEGLGYVDASHQLSPPRKQTVLTYFRAFGGGDVRGTRTALASRTWEELAADVLGDLRPAHPELRDRTSRLDLVVWGHAMPRPGPGFLQETQRASGAGLSERIAWAHTDGHGVALFEEAQRAGVLAAEHVALSARIDLGATWT